MIVVYYPTKRYGGIDMLWASIFNQTALEDERIVLLVQDELREERAFLWSWLERGAAAGIEIHHLDVPKAEGDFTNLTAGYNAAMDFAVDHGAEYLVSLQDFILLAPQALERALYVCRANASHRPLYTALLSLWTPPPLKDDLRADASIFQDTIVTDWVGERTWQDVRQSQREEVGVEPGVYGTSWIEWEINFALIPRELLLTGVRFDPAFGKGLAFDHQVYAWQLAQRHGATVVIDTTLENKGVDHRSIWPETAEEQEARDTAQAYMTTHYLPQMMGQGWTEAA